MMSTANLFDKLKASYGLLYPTDYIAATFLTLGEAERTASALSEAQFDDVRLFNNQELIEHIEETQSRQALMDHLHTKSDKAKVVANGLSEQLKGGNHVIFVLAKDGADIQRALLILRAGTPQPMKHYGQWRTTILNKQHVVPNMSDRK